MFAIAELKNHLLFAIDGHPVRQIDDIINYIESQKNIGDNLTATLQARPNTISQTSLQEQQQQQQQQQDQQQPGMIIIPELPHNPGHRHHLPRSLQPLP